MVDIETTGTNPNHNAMIQLAAIRFDPETQDLDMNMFDQALGIPGNRYWSEDTRDWWARQNLDILNNRIWPRMRDPRTVMFEFAEWAVRDLDEIPVLWAKPISFEWPFLESYFTEYGIVKPFLFYECKDLRSVLWALGQPNLDRELPFEGEAHDALNDVLHQISVLFEVLNASK